MTHAPEPIYINIVGASLPGHPRLLRIHHETRDDLLLILDHPPSPCADLLIALHTVSV